MEHSADNRDHFTGLKFYHLQMKVNILLAYGRKWHWKESELMHGTYKYPSTTAHLTPTMTSRLAFQTRDTDWSVICPDSWFSTWGRRAWKVVNPAPQPTLHSDPASLHPGICPSEKTLMNCCPEPPVVSREESSPIPISCPCSTWDLNCPSVPTSWAPTLELVSCVHGTQTMKEGNAQPCKSLRVYPKLNTLGFTVKYLENLSEVRELL